MQAEHLTQAEADEYALGVLDPDAQRAFAQHALACDECRARILDAQRLIALLALAPPVQAPPPGLRRRVLRAARARRSRALLSRVARLSPAAAALVAAAAAVVSIAGVISLRGQVESLRDENALLQSKVDDALSQRFEIVALTNRLSQAEASAWEARYESQLDRDMLMAVLSPDSQTAEVISVADGFTPVGRLIWDGQQQRLWFVASRLPKLAEGETYQLWVNVDGRYRSLGTFQPDENGFARFVRYLPEGLSRYESAVVTIERAGGSPERTGPGVFFVADLSGFR